MAGGACAPDLFSGIIGVTVLHTDVGVGTIVGSLLFNHLCIIGGSAVAVGLLVLNWKTTIRETVFYIISLICLLVFLLDRQIEWWEALLLVAIYVLYVVVCAYYAPISKVGFVERKSFSLFYSRSYLLANQLINHSFSIIHSDPNTHSTNPLIFTPSPHDLVPSPHHIVPSDHHIVSSPQLLDGLEASCGGGSDSEKKGLLEVFIPSRDYHE